jgi:protein TonB
LDAIALNPISHSRSTLAAVVVAHVAAGLLVVQLFEAKRYLDPAPLMVDLLPAPEQKVDTAPVPLPQAPEPVKEIRKQPEPANKPEPVVREEPKPVERVIRPEPAPAPPRPEPPPPAPEPIVAAAPEPSPITVPMPQPIAPEPQPIAPEPLPQVPEDVVLSREVLAAMYLRNPKPGYPAASRRLGEQGTVQLRVFVTAAGDPARIELKAGSGYARLDQSALETVQRWKFVPARRGEQAVDAWVVVPIRFSIKG